MDTYRCVLTFTYGTGNPVVADSGPKSREEAMAEFDVHLAAGGFGPHSHRRAVVVSDQEWSKVRPLGGAS